MKVLIEKWTEKDANDQDIERSLYLESDDMQFILRKYMGKFDKEGKETTDTLGYFTNAQSALTRLLRMKLMSSTVGTLDALLIDMKRIEHEIKETWSVELNDGERAAV